MGKVARPRIVTKERLDTAGLPEHVQVVLAEIAERAREGVLALSVACGLQVVGEILAADVARVCGPKGKHDRVGGLRRRRALRSRAGSAKRPRPASPSCSAGTSPAWTCWRCSSTACTWAST